MYFGLIVIGLLIGGGFLGFLLLDDWRAGRRNGPTAGEGQSPEGVWPPPPRRIAVSPPPSAPRSRSAYGVWIRNPVLRAFYGLRYAAVGVVLLAYLISDSYPALSFGATLAATAAGYAAFSALFAVWKRRGRRDSTPAHTASVQDQPTGTQ